MVNKNLIHVWLTYPTLYEDLVYDNIKIINMDL